MHLDFMENKLLVCYGMSSLIRKCQKVEEKGFSSKKKYVGSVNHDILTHHI